MSSAARIRDDGDAAAAHLISEVERLRRTRPEEALAVLRQSFGVVTRRADPARRGELWRLRGHVLRRLRRIRPAIRAYRAAEIWFRRAGEERERGRCAIGLVDSLMYVGEYDAAKRTAAWGRRALARSGEPADLARLLNNEGNLHHRLDRPAQALVSYRRARLQLQRAGDRRGAALIGGNIANCYSLLGRCQDARKLYTGVRRDLQRSGHAVEALNAAYNLAYLDFLEHRHERALAGLERVRAQAAASGVPTLVALTALDCAEILLRLGAHQEAAEEAKRALANLAELGLAYERAKAMTFLALAEFRFGRVRSAERRLEGALAVFHAEGNLVWAGEALVGLATLWWSEHNARGAAVLLEAAASRFAKARDRERKVCASALLARALAEVGQIRRARVVLQRARTGSRGPGSIRERHLLQVVGAEVAWRQGYRGRARNLLRKAAAESEQLAAMILDEQWRSSFWAEWGWPHMELARLEIESGNLEEAFEVLERGRGRTLSHMTRPSRGSRGGLSGPLRDWAAARMASDRTRTTRSADRIAASSMRSPVVMASPPRLHGSGELSTGMQIRVRRVQADLVQTTALLDFVQHRGELSAFVLLPDSVDYHPMLANDSLLRSLCHRAQFLLRGSAVRADTDSGSVAALTAVLTEISSQVLWPIFARLPTLPRRLAVIPVGPLAQLPWAALPLPDGRALCEVCELVLLPGMRVSLAAKPAFEDSNQPLVIGVDAGELDAVAEEIRAIAELFPGARTLTGGAATSDQLLAHAEHARWLHFAGHGIYRGDAPDASGLRLHDRWLDAGELQSLRLGAAWVMLTACQTARSLVRPGEEWFGLPRSLLLSGAHAVIAPQWDVEDEAASRLSVGFYDRLRGGDSPAAALRAAQAAQKRNGAHPLHWAGFVLLSGLDGGDVAARRALEPSTGTRV